MLFRSDVLKPNVDNLATLCVDQIDADKLALKRKVQESLARLENQRLVSRNGDLWYFLTNEERDVAREIGHVEVSASEKSRLLCELLFDDILDQQAKVRHRDTKADYEINRLLDGAPWKNANHELALEILSPLGDDYERLNDAQCILRSSEGNGKALIRLSEGNRFDIELSLYQQIEKYIDSPKASNASASLKTILINRKDENRERRTRLRDQLSTLMVTGDCYALGQKQQFKVSTPSSLLDELVNYLISNTYTKLPYLKYRQPDAIAEIRAVLNADDIGQHSLGLGGDVGNPLALKEMRDFLQLKATTERVLLSDVVDRFTGMPWGWKPEWEVVLLIARLFMAGEIKLMLEGSDVDPKSAIDPLTKSVKFKQVSILKRKTADAATISKARDLHKELFSKLAKEDEDGLVADFRINLKNWQSELEGYAHVASTKHHPGKPTIDQALTRIKKQLAIRDTFEFTEALLTSKNDWLDASEDIHDVLSFYKTQITTWRRMLESLTDFTDNQEALLKDTQAATALHDLEAIRANETPYGQVNRIDTLISTVTAVNDRIASQERESALLSIDQRINEVQKTLDDVHAEADLRNKALQPLQQVKMAVAALFSIPKIRFFKEQAGIHLDTAMDVIALATKPVNVTTPPTGSSTAPVITGGAAPAKVVIPPKPSKVIRAADFNAKSYLETEAEVDDYINKLKAELIAAIKAGQRARIQ